MKQIITKKTLCIFCSITYLFSICLISNNYPPKEKDATSIGKNAKYTSYNNKLINNLGKTNTIDTQTYIEKTNETNSEHIANVQYESNIISNTPSGLVQEIQITSISTTELNRVDLSPFTFQYITFIWEGDNFLWGYEDKDSTNLKEVKISDDIELGKVKISDLYAYTNEHALIKSDYLLKDFKIHLIDPDANIDRTKIGITNDSSGYNSGSKYSSLNIIPRENWSTDGSINDPRLEGSGGRLVWKPYYYDVNKIIVHHTANPDNYHPDPASQVRGIYNWHAYSVPWFDGEIWRNGWGDIGYNYLIDWMGNIYEGKLGGDEAKGYHAGSSNANSIGISLIGDFTNSAPTQAARDSLTILIAEKAAFYDFTPSYPSTVMGHRDVAATQCPGNTFYPMLPSITSLARSYKDGNFSNIKSTISQVNSTFANASYDQYKLILLFDSNVSLDTLKGLIPFVGDNPADWTGITYYFIDEKTVTFYLNYSPYGTQSTENRLKTLIKVFSLKSEVEAAGLRQKYGVF